MSRFVIALISLIKFYTRYIVLTKKRKKKNYLIKLLFYLHVNITNIIKIYTANII